MFICRARPIRIGNYSIVLFWPGWYRDWIGERNCYATYHVVRYNALHRIIMKEKPKEPFVPHAMHDTVRQEIIAELLEGPCSARDLSVVIRIPERDVAGHLEHIRKTIAATGNHLVIIPAECKKCGFVFSKRDKLTRPGKCPLCKGESIMEPQFMIENRVEDK